MEDGASGASNRECPTRPIGDFHHVGLRLFSVVRSMFEELCDVIRDMLHVTIVGPGSEAAWGMENTDFDELDGLTSE